MRSARCTAVLCRTPQNGGHDRSDNLVGSLGDLLPCEAEDEPAVQDERILTIPIALERPPTGVMRTSIDLDGDAQSYMGKVDLGNHAPRHVVHGEVRLPWPRATTSQEQRHALLSLRSSAGRRSLHEACKQGRPSLSPTQPGGDCMPEVLRRDESLLERGIKEILGSARAHDDQRVDECLPDRCEADAVGAAYGDSISAPEHRDTRDGQLGLVGHHDDPGIPRQRPAAATEGQVSTDARTRSIGQSEDVAPSIVAEMGLTRSEDICPTDPRPIAARHASARSARADSASREVLRRHHSPAPGSDCSQALQVLVGMRHGEHDAPHGPGAWPTIHSPGPGW